ncbi:hypothetical protein ID866_9440, partial [Astraeus odoratus]
KVSIKTPPGGLVNEEAIIKNFLKEAHTWSKLYHENVLPLIGITTEVDYTVSMVSKWQEKGNARDYVQDARVDPRPLIQRISSGLQYMHSHVKGPIAHGDLKGANVLISDEGKALLTDFGLPYMPNSSCSITTSTPKGGTTRWSSPELLDGGNKTPEADVWAFGMTALELFTRTDPYPSCPTTIAVITSIALGKSPERPNEKDTGARLTDEWWNMLNMCWKFKPNDRISIEEIVKAIKILYGTISPLSSVADCLLGCQVPSISRVLLVRQVHDVAITVMGTTVSS